ncbi:MAG: ferritin-like domain-containing protein [Chitinophagaceae bacterium]|nr:ferritin-like domain-containing protein [Chitinophagaceae bacterium]MBL0066982.1 ferritin-like domain-containing protein [Chitinophagaceae bacterium]MBP6232254.1 ferritin-like domain-containing protein [Chitinophagaceae bacterium]MBP6415934.1 ferritin-like domain-containing protein [Chitinophagaceae bacterium]
MNTTKSKSGSGANGSTSKRKSGSNGTQKENTNIGMPPSQLMKLFEEELKDIYWAEKALTKAIPKMIKNATSEELIEALENHLAETEEQVKRVEQVFEILGKKATAKKCEAMEGLLKEAEAIMEECEEGAMCDAGIISAAQKVEHYEIASYGTLRQFAETLGLEEVEELLQTTLDEEKAADEKLTEVAVAAVNIQANEEEEEVEEAGTQSKK